MKHKAEIWYVDAVYDGDFVDTTEIRIDCENQSDNFEDN